MTPMFSIENSHALWFIFLLPLLWWLSSKTKTTLGRKHLQLLTLFRAASLLAVILGLAQPVIRYASQDISVIYALDVSRSVATGFIDKSLRWIDEVEERHNPAQSKIVIFGQNRAIVSSTDEARAITIADLGQGALSSDSTYVEQSGTNLEAAIDESLALLGADHVKRIVLFSDGNQTDGSLLDLVQSAESSGARIYPMLADSAQVADAWISNVRLPDRLRALEPTTTLVSVYSPSIASVEIVISTNSQMIAKQVHSVERGFNDLQINMRLPEAGSVPLDVIMAVSYTHLRAHET